MKEMRNGLLCNCKANQPEGVALISSLEAHGGEKKRWEGFDPLGRTLEVIMIPTLHPYQYCARCLCTMTQ